MSREVVGTFIDAVYAIAITILALEIPESISGSGTAAEFGAVLLEYVLAYSILFSFWVQHRRGNEFTEFYERRGLLLNAAILALVCLVPRATTLVFDYGQNVTLLDIWAVVSGSEPVTPADFADLYYVTLVVTADLLIYALLRSAASAHIDSEVAARLRRQKWVTTCILASVAVLSFALPVQNRVVLTTVPLALFFEDELARLVLRRGRPRDAQDAFTERS